MGNYRPVCHLINLDKLVEHVVWDQLLQQCVNHELINPKPNFVCHLQETATRAADTKLLTAIIMLKHMAAYYLVDHGDLSEKTMAYNFHNKTGLLATFLTGGSPQL